MKKRLICVLFFIMMLITVSCGGKKEEVVATQSLPEINAETETEITIWCWNVAAKALQAVVPMFNEKYPKIKVSIEEFGTQPYEKYGVVFASGEGMPDISPMESDFVHTYAENYPQVFLDMTDLAPDNWESTMDPSKIPTSYDSEGRLVAIPWDSGPVVMYYRADMFEEAGIDPESIETYDDYIAAGKKLQEKLPGTKMLGFGFTIDDGVWRSLMAQNGTYYLNTDGEVTINSEESLEAINMIKKFIDEGIVMDTVNWDGLIRANKSGQIATTITGGWWGGTLKDQIPELAGKFRIMRLPAFEKGSTSASTLGGSAFMITATDPIKKAASWAFLESALLSEEAHLVMYNDFGLFPSYLPVYKTEEFLQTDSYFGNQDYNKLLGEVTEDILPVIYNSDDYSEIRNIATSTYEEILNNDTDPKLALDNAAAQINSSTGRAIAN